MTTLPTMSGVQPHATTEPDEDPELPGETAPDSDPHTLSLTTAPDSDPHTLSLTAPGPRARAPGPTAGGSRPTATSPTPPRPRPAPRRIPPRIGRYRVTKVLGEGGMGTVFAAYDDELARPVALKVLRGSGHGSTAKAKRARTRMAREAQAMAQLSHPNVVQVYDVGIHDGELFIAMELVRGCDLQDWLAELGRPEDRAARWPEVLGLFVGAARGLAAAHAAGLVHRDFKPANVLVGNDGVVRVLDFGLARAVEVDDEGDSEGDSEGEGEAKVEGGAERGRFDEDGVRRPQMLGTMTAVGTVLGTPAYFSPEQMRGEVLDAKSDQFSFCVSVHEGLLGLRPFAGVTFEELAASLEQGQRVAVARNSPVPRWLLDVLDRGLAPAPEDRWPTMDALIEALLDDPAKRRRRRLVTGAAGVAALGLAGGLWGHDLWERGQCAVAGEAITATWNAEANAEVAVAFAASGAVDSDATLARIHPRLDAWTEQWRGAREDACLLARTRAPEGQAQARCLERQRWQLDSLVELLATADRATVFEAAEAVAGLPAIPRCSEPAWLAAEPPALPAESGSGSGSGSGLGPGQAAHRDLARVYVLERLGRYDEALTLAEAALRSAEELGDEVLEAEAQTKVAAMRWRLGDEVEAEAELRAAYFLAGRLHHGKLAAAAAFDLAHIVGQELARPGEGREWLEHARMNVASMGLDPDQDPTSFVMRGEIEDGDGNYEEALRAHEMGLALRREQLAPDHPDIADSWSNIGQVRHALGDYAGALAAYDEALVVGEAALGPSHPVVANILDSRAVTLIELDRADEALAASQRARAIREAALGPGDPSLAATANTIGAALYALGRTGEAVAAFEEALAITEQNYGPDHPEVAINLANLAVLDASLGEIGRSLARQRRVLAIEEASLRPDHPDLIWTLRTLGYRLEQLGRYDEALAQHERALAIHEQAFGPEHPETADALEAVAGPALALGQAERARDLYQRAAELRAAALGPDHPQRAAELDMLGAAELSLGQIDAAIAHHREALALREAPTTLIHLARALLAAARPADALERLDRAQALIEDGAGYRAKLRRADILHLRGRCLGAMGETAAARTALEAELELRAGLEGDPARTAAAQAALEGAL